MNIKVLKKLFDEKQKGLYIKEEGRARTSGYLHVNE